MPTAERTYNKLECPQQRWLNLERSRGYRQTREAGFFRQPPDTPELRPQTPAG